MIASGQPFDTTLTSDETLAERARRGSGPAFAALVARHDDAVYVIARNMCATPRDAEEVVRQAFLSAWRDLKSLPAGARFRTWLYRIAMDTALIHRRRDLRSRSSSLEVFLPRFDRSRSLVESKGRWPELDGSSPERPEVSGLLREGLESIDDRTRAGFVLLDLLEAPLEEAAVILKTSPWAVQRDAHRARLMLRGFIDGL